MQNYKQCLLVAGLGLFVAAGGLTGCSYMNAKKARETGRTTNQVANDKATTGRVRDALASNPIYKFPTVDVQTFDGTVQLTGFVNSDAQKNEATQVAQNVPGVRKVLNDIAVQAPTPEARGGAGNGQLYNYGQGSAGSVSHAPIYTPSNAQQAEPGQVGQPGQPNNRQQAPIYNQQPTPNQPANNSNSGNQQ